MPSTSAPLLHMLKTCSIRGKVLNELVQDNWTSSLLLCYKRGRDGASLVSVFLFYYFYSGYY